ncbi:pyroglutamyl peptidase [Streptomyces meridianus]|uniref:Pyroglutamyl peptidase n=1 Tax=Streptomyces meridianus TaxID=2938945 RepID=A0ABT0XAS8_9ACTN|nr:pyroglutamyl peptidase [Streptomyces meridianus]MCM2579625.1 pyroglutamyl peptidase [Streptomyces meridianus]
MRPHPPTRLVVIGVVMAACAPLTVAAPAAAEASAGAELTVEEQRLTGPVPEEILQRSGFDQVAPLFTRALAHVRTEAGAQRLATTAGKALWRRAVDRAQGRGPAGGDLSRDDDRPLYWARLGMTKAVRQWQPSFALDDAGHQGIIDRIERSSRGQDTIDLPAGHDVKRIVLTGFDPFQLDADARRSNPSGAAALALDGVTVRTASGPARIETAVFPVRWEDFGQGTVEKTLLPHFRKGPRDADMFTTISQGRVGRFDVERFNGAWRGGYPDNNRASLTEMIPVPEGLPTVHPQPQWTTTSLPYKKIVEAGTGRFPVYDNTAVTEIPAGQSEPVNRPDGPTEGSVARAGGGGNYLSNEIAYRATLLRDALRLRIPGGHLHTPVLEFGEGNTDPATGDVTDDTFVANRLAITAQVRAVIEEAAGTLD